MEKVKPRIFIGISEIGDAPLDIGRRLRELGYDVTSVTSEPDFPVLKLGVRHDHHANKDPERSTRNIESIVEFCRVAPSQDIFIFSEPKVVVKNQA